MPPMPTLPVFLVHFDAPEWCASSARSVLDSQGVTVDLVVVDNGQSAGPPLETLLPPEVRVIRTQSNNGYAGGANVALRHSREHHPDAPLIVIGSHDLHLRPDALARLVDAAGQDASYGVLAPALEAPFTSSGGRWDGWKSEEIPLDGQAGIIERDWVSGTCLGVRPRCVSDVGPFDEWLGSYLEDVDFCLRARDAGWKVVVVANARMTALGSRSPIVRSLIEANTVLLVRKRRGAMAGMVAAARLALWTARALVGRWVPWRSAEQRVTSERFLAHHRTAVPIVWRKWMERREAVSSMPADRVER